jgi:hypothetical protein
LSQEGFLQKLKNHLTNNSGLKDVLTEMPRETGFFNEQLVWSINAETDFEPFEAYETVDGKIIAGYGPATHVGDIIMNYLLDREKYSDIVDQRELVKERDEIIKALHEKGNWQKYRAELKGLIDAIEKADEIAKNVSTQIGVEVKQILPYPPDKNAFFCTMIDSKGLPDDKKVEAVDKAWKALSTAFNEFLKHEGEIIDNWRNQVEAKFKEKVLPEEEGFARALSELLKSWTSKWCSYEIPSGFPGFEGGSAKWRVLTHGEPYVMIFETEDGSITVTYQTFRTHTSVNVDHKRGEDTDRLIVDMANKGNWPKYKNSDLKDVIERYELGEELAKKAKEITGMDIKHFIPVKHCHDAAFYITFNSKGMNPEKKIEEIKKLLDLLEITYSEFKKADEAIRLKYGLKK